MTLLEEPVSLEFTADLLCDQVFTQAPGTIAQLDLGANLVLANCGRGAALIGLAHLFPRSRFFGLESDATDLASARAEARAHWLQNIWFEPDGSALPLLAGIFHVAIRLPNRWGPTLIDLAHLLQARGQCFDVNLKPADPQGYREAGLSALRQFRTPDYFCSISRK